MILIIFLIIINTQAFAESSPNYCDQFISESIDPLNMLFDIYHKDKWTINPDGTLNIPDKKSSRSTFTVGSTYLENTYTYILNSPSKVTIINKEIKNQKPTYEWTVSFFLDGNNRIKKMIIKRNLDVSGYHPAKTIIFSNKNGICYPDLAVDRDIESPTIKSQSLVQQFLDPSKEKDSILQSDFYTSLCQELAAYLDTEKKIKDLTCSCGTDAINAEINRIINKHNEIKISENEKYKVQLPTYDKSGHFLFSKLDSAAPDLSPMHRALSYLQSCDAEPAVKDAALDPNLRDKPTPLPKDEDKNPVLIH